MPDLKPCPFCGGKDSGMLTTSYDGYWFAVFCENCMVQTRKCRQEKDAIEAWNRRDRSVEPPCRRGGQA